MGQRPLVAAVDGSGRMLVRGCARLVKGLYGFIIVPGLIAESWPIIADGSTRPLDGNS
jgi:hypothetical protein